MDTLITYLVATTISSGIFYISYVLLLRKEALFRFNRIYLLSGMAVSYLFPLITFFPFQLIASLFNQGNAGLLKTFTLPTIEISANTESNPLFIKVLSFIYLIGLLIFTVRLIIRISGIYKLKTQSEPKNGEKTNIHWSKSDIPPFSFFGRMYLPETLKNTSQANEIIRHELIHINSLHSYDILFTQVMQILFWFNPFIPLIEVALREIHEFEADKAVIDGGTDPVAYTKILFGQDKAAQAVILGNNFNYSLIKRRLTMFYKKSTRFARLKAALVLPVAVCSVLIYSVGCNQSANKSVSTADDTVSANSGKVMIVTDSTGKQEKVVISEGSEVPPPPPPPPPPPVSSKSSLASVPPPPPPPPAGTKDPNGVYVVVENMPQFPGGEEARMKYVLNNVKYPPSAKEKGIEGMVVVSFVVEKNGSISEAKVIRSVEKSLDEEAVRVIKNMPKWKPGIQNGQPVRVNLNFPVFFKLK